jgi:hypothetical protein
MLSIGSSHNDEAGDFEQFIYNTFVKIHGFSVQKDALKFLVEVFEQLKHDKAALLEAIDWLIATYQKSESRSLSPREKICAIVSHDFFSRNHDYDERGVGKAGKTFDQQKHQ